jgi:nucleotide-binding universal stress UspA family protein
VSTILIGVDSSARSEDAIALGRQLAHAGTVEIVVATVTSSAHPARDEAHATVRRMSGLLSGVPAERIRTGVVAASTPAQGLHDLAATETAALLIVGSTHTGPLGRVHPGSTGERLLTGAPCAVAVAPHGYRTSPERPIARVGVAWDGSREARTALAAATAAARAFDAQLQIITVIPTSVLGAPVVLDAPSYAAVVGDVTKQARADLDVVAASMSELVATEGVVLQGRPSRELAISSANLDLLFVGSRGYGPAHAVLAGGTSGPLMSSAHCPVIVLARGVEAPLAEIFEPAATRI